MDLLRELFDWIADEAGLERDAEWHCGHLPPEAAEQGSESPAAVLLERGGEPQKPITRGLAGSYLFQVVAYGPTYFTARDFAYTIHDLIADRGGADLGEWTACVIEALEAPEFRGYDERFRYEFSARYVVRATNIAAWQAA